MANLRNEDKYYRIPLTEIVKPVDQYIAHVDKWWLVDNGNVLIWKATNMPQCNRSREVVEHVRGERQLEVVFIPLAFIPRNNW